MLHDSELVRRMSEVVANFAVLEEYYLKTSLGKVVRSRAAETVVDDAFYLLKKCASRALISGNVNVICAVLNHVNGAIQQEYCDWLRSLIKRGDVTPLNCMEQSARNTMTLMRGLEADFALPAASLAANDRFKIESCLADLVSTASGLRHMLQSAMERLCYEDFAPRVGPLIDTHFMAAHFTVAEGDAAAVEEESAAHHFARPLIAAVDPIIAQYKVRRCSPERPRTAFARLNGMRCGAIDAAQRNGLWRASPGSCILLGAGIGKAHVHTVLYGARCGAVSSRFATVDCILLRPRRSHSARPICAIEPDMRDAATGAAVGCGCRMVRRRVVADNTGRSAPRALAPRGLSCR